MFFQGVADAGGNLYWAECTPNGVCDVVSVRSDGEIRFRAPLPGVHRLGGFDRGHLAVVGEVVIEGLERGTVRAFKTTDGRQAWSRDLGLDLCQGARSPEPSSLAIRSITSAHAVELFLQADGDPCGSKTRGHWVISLWAATGRWRWATEYEQAPSGLVASEDGDLFFEAYLRADTEWSRPSLVSLSPSGRERWRRGASWSSLPVAAFAGRLFGATREVWQAANGAQLFHLPLEEGRRGQRGAFTLVNENSAFVIASPKLACPGAGCFLALHKIDLTSRELSWSAMLSEGDRASFTQPLLTSNETILFAQSGTSSSLLREFSSEGQELHSAPLPHGRYAAAAALTSSRWITAIESPAQEIRAFEVDAQGIRNSGWISWAGNAGCSGAPQAERRTVAARRPPSR